MINPFSLIILAALLLEYALGVTASLLNLKALSFEPPALLAGIYQPAEYRKSQEYTRTTTRFELATSTFHLALLLVFWFAHGFNYLDRLVRGWGYTPIAGGLLYIGILFTIYNLLTLPFSLYATFVIEERFGFNRTTVRTFVMDRVKGLVLLVLLGAPLLAGIMALFTYGGDYVWTLCWMAATVFSIAMQFVAPVWILPLFNRFTPMEAGELKNAILSYARSQGYEVGNIFVMDGSKRTSKANAFFTGFGRTRRIALFDTLIKNHSVPELVAVLAHEIGHYKKKHVLQGIIIGILHSGIVFYLFAVFLKSPGLYQAFYMDEPSIYAGGLFFGLLYTPIELLLSIVLQMLSRKHEREADRFAALTIDEPRSMTDALKKLSATSLTNLSPHPFYVFLNYSHPSLLERVRAIEQYQREREKEKVSRR